MPKLALSVVDMDSISAADGVDHYRFYRGQIFVFDIVLTMDPGQDLEDGWPVSIDPIVLPAVGVPTKEIKFGVYPETQAYKYEAGDDYNIIVYMKRTGVGKAEAQLSVWVMSGLNYVAIATSDTVTAEALLPTSLGIQNPQAKITFEIAAPTIYAALGQSGIYIPQPDHDMVPSEGYFGYLQLEVFDVDNNPLPNVRLLYYAAGLGIINLVWAGKVWIYPSYGAKTTSDALPYPFIPDPILGLGVPTTTNEYGVAEAFICAKQEQDAGAELKAHVGGAPQDVTPFVVARLSQSNTTDGLGDPYTDPETVALDGTDTTTVDVYIPKYRLASKFDRVYLFCNGEYQYVRNFDDPNQDPLGSMPMQTNGLYTSYYSEAQRNNCMSYMVVSTEDCYYSPIPHFNATGPLVPIGPKSDLPRTAAAPILMSADGTVIDYIVNFDAIAGGVRVRVPFDGLDVHIGDMVMLTIYLNAYRQYPYDSQPRERVINGPAQWEVSPRTFALKYVEWWFQAECFTGFGQNDNGDMGTFVAEYSIMRGVPGAMDMQQHDVPPEYVSELLSLPLDTIIPIGYDDHSGYKSGGDLANFALVQS